MLRLQRNPDPLSAERVFAPWRNYRIQTTRGSFEWCTPDGMAGVLLTIENAQQERKRQDRRYEPFEVIGIIEVDTDVSAVIAKNVENDNVNV